MEKEEFLENSTKMTLGESRFNRGKCGVARKPVSFRFAALVVLLIVSFVMPRPAAGVDCGSAPSGSGGAWFRTYQDWCHQCGGTPSTNASPATCTPGSNWGGKGSTNSGTGGSAEIIANGIKDAFDQERERAYRENAEMMRSLDAASRERIREEDERARAAAEASRQEEESLRQNALSSMKGMDSVDLSTRPSPGGAELALKPSTELFGISGNPTGLGMKEISPSQRTSDMGAVPITGTTPSLLRGKEAGGHRVVDCETSVIVRKRLYEGLHVQKEAISRTTAQVEAARREHRAASAEASQAVLISARDELLSAGSEFLKSTKMLRVRIASMKAQGVSAEDRRVWLQTLDTLYVAATEGIEKVGTAGKAGYAYGTEIREEVRTLNDHVNQLHKFLSESGIAEKVGESLSESVGGPLGALSFRMAKLSLDVGVAMAQGVLSEDEYLRARENLDAMSYHFRNAEESIRNLDEDISRYCQAGSTRDRGDGRALLKH